MKVANAHGLFPSSLDPFLSSFPSSTFDSLLESPIYHPIIPLPLPSLLLPCINTEQTNAGSFLTIFGPLQVPPPTLECPMSESNMLYTCSTTNASSCRTADSTAHFLQHVAAAVLLLLLFSVTVCILALPVHITVSSGVNNPCTRASNSSSLSVVCCLLLLLNEGLYRIFHVLLLPPHCSHAMRSSVLRSLHSLSCYFV